MTSNRKPLPQALPSREGGFRRLFLASCFLLLASCCAFAQDEAGVSLNLGVDKKITKKWTVSSEAEYRSRNNFRTFDLWTVSLETSYKLAKPLKVTAGYELQVENNHEKVSYHSDGSLNGWRPSFTGIGHRFYASATGSKSIGRFSFALRERYQYTYTPETTRQRYDFDDATWGDKVIGAKHKHVLRTRLKGEYNIKGSKVDPFASVEMYNSLNKGGRFDRMRYQAGFEYKYKKVHSFTLFYRYQDLRFNDPSEGDNDTHLLGVGYSYKF